MSEAAPDLTRADRRTKVIDQVGLFRYLDALGLKPALQPFMFLLALVVPMDPRICQIGLQKTDFREIQRCVIGISEVAHLVAAADMPAAALAHNWSLAGLKTKSWTS